MLWSSAEKWAKSAAAGFRPLGFAPNHPIRPLLCHIHGIFSKFRHLIKDYPGLAQNFPVRKLKCEKLAAFPTCDHFFPAVAVGGDNKWSVAGQEKTGGGLPHCPHCPSSTTPSLIIGLARWWVSLNLIQVQRFLTKVSSDRLMSHLIITGHCQSLSWWVWIFCHLSQIKVIFKSAQVLCHSDWCGHSECTLLQDLRGKDSERQRTLEWLLFRDIFWTGIWKISSFWHTVIYDISE